MRRVWRGVLVLAFGLAACSVDQVREPPPSGAAAQAPGPVPQSGAAPASGRPAAPSARPTPLRPSGGIALAPPRGAEARDVPPTPLLAGQPAAPLSGATPRPAPPPGDISLDFNDADIRVVVDTVLRDMLKRNYIIDPEVTGTVSLTTSSPLRSEALLPTLEAVLNSRGATMVETDGVIRVTMLREGGKLRQTPRIGGARGNAGQQIEAFPMGSLLPSEAQHLLDPVLSQGRVLVADDSRRLLLIQGNAQELAAARDTLKIFDIDQLTGTSVSMVLLQNAEATPLVAELNNLFVGVRKANEPGAIRFLPVERLNAVIVLARQPRYMEDARTWIGRLDKARRGNEPQLFVYNVQHGKAVELARTLRGIFSNEPTGEGEAQQGGPGEPPDYGSVPLPGATRTSATISGATSAPPISMASAGLAGAPGGAPLAPGEDPSSRPPPPVRDEPTGGDKGGPRIRADVPNNSLLVHATPRDYAKVEQVLQQIDIPPLQVLIEATIAEVVLSNELRYGVQYFVNSGQLGGILTQSPLTSSGITPPLPGFAFAASGGLTQPRVLIDALSERTQTTVLSTPRLLVLDNQTARLQVGDVVPIVTSTAVSTLTATPLQVNSIQYRDTGVVLEVTPRVNASGFVTLDISQSVSDVVRTTTSNIDSPTIRQRRIRSSIGVQSGSTILLGGLIRDDNGRSAGGIPYLHDLPLVGPLFGNRDETSGRTELVVMLTPRVVRNQEEAADMTHELSRKYQSVLLSEPGMMTTPRPPR